MLRRSVSGHLGETESAAEGWMVLYIHISFSCLLPALQRKASNKQLEFYPSKKLANFYSK